MKKPHGGRHLLWGKANRRDDRGSAIVIVIIAMAMTGILAATILWAAYLNYRIKINDLKVKNSFYSAETVVEQIEAGVKKNVSEAINEAYQEVVSNWDALGTDANREGYFAMAYIEAVENRFKATPAGSPNRYDKDILKGFVDSGWWTEGSPDGYIVNRTWEQAVPEFKAANAVNGYGSMSLKNICIEFYDSEGYLSIINTDIAIDVPKLRFTQAGTIDRLYPYVLIGGEGIMTESAAGNVTISGNIYGGVDGKSEGGIRIGANSHVRIEDADYIISGGDIVVGSDPVFAGMVSQNAELVVGNVTQEGKGFQTNIYADGLTLNGSHLDMSGRMYIADDLLLSGKGSRVSLAGQYYGYGNTNTSTLEEETTRIDEEGNAVKELQKVNPADTSSAIVINGKDSAVDLTGLATLQLAGRAYVSLPADDEKDNGMPHVLTGESISVKSNQIAYLVPEECVGTLNGEPVIGQNPVSFQTWKQMLQSLPEYLTDADEISETSEESGELSEGADIAAAGGTGNDFRIVDAGRAVSKLGGERLLSYGIPDIRADDLGGVDLNDPARVITELNRKAVINGSGVRFLYQPDKEQVYLYLVMDSVNASKYFAQYYHAGSNKASLDNYFHQYVTGGIRLNDNAQGYTVAGNSMVSATDVGDGDVVMILLEDEEPGHEDVLKEPEEIMESYENLVKNLLEEDPGTKETVFENLVRVSADQADPESVEGLQEYLDRHGHKVEFTIGEGANALKAVLVDSGKLSGGVYKVGNPTGDRGIRLVIAIGDVEVTGDFRGLIIASGRILISDNAVIRKDGEGVYAVLQAKSGIEGDGNIPANVLYNGPGMVKNGYEEAAVDEDGNINIDYSKIVRYENWIKK